MRLGLAMRTYADEVKSTLERRDGHWRRNTRNTSRLESINSKPQTFLIFSWRQSTFPIYAVANCEDTEKSTILKQAAVNVLCVCDKSKVDCEISNVLSMTCDATWTLDNVPTYNLLWGTYTFSLVPRPHPLMRRNGLVNQVKSLGLVGYLVAV